MTAFLANNPALDLTKISILEFQTSGNYSTNNIDGNALHPGTNSSANSAGPLRGGIYATATSTRVQSGATYFGIMEMSGNLSERSITLRNAAGRSYRGHHGDGILWSTGDGNVDYWPGINGNADKNTVNTVFGGVTGINANNAADIRGGTYNQNNNPSFGQLFMAVSSRGEDYYETGRGIFSGIRGVRSRP